MQIIENSKILILKNCILQKKKSKEHSHANKENMLGKRPIEPTHSNFTIADDSNTCKNMIKSMIILSIL